MTVFVDDMAASYGRMKMYHLVADTYDELHAMAARIGVARRWFQGDHYDICKSKRALAVSYGAKEITWRDCGLMMVARRRQDPNAQLLTPEHGREWLSRRHNDSQT